MSRITHRHRAQHPVFVDASGRRQQTLKVAGILGVLVAVGYLCVLVSTVLGGPTCSRCSSAPQAGAHGLVNERPGAAVVRRSGGTGGAAHNRHCPPDVHLGADFGADLYRGCHSGEGQADGSADTVEQADQDRTMTSGAGCVRSL
jgi:hypothetical protein